MHNTLRRIGVDLLVLLACLSVGVPDADAGELKLPRIFGDHMVLQRGKPVPIWGWAEPGFDIKVSYAGHEARTAVDDEGRWSVQLPSMSVVDEPQSLFVFATPEALMDGDEITGYDGVLSIREFKNVVVGEVWLCGGQSNMEWQVRSAERAEEFAAQADLPGVRLFKVAPYRTSLEPEDDIDDAENAAWTVCTPETAMNFSAVGYHFGRRLHEELGVPVGLVSSVWGGTRIEAWTSRPTLEATPEARPILELFDRITRQWDDILAGWEAEQNRPEYHDDPGDELPLEELTAGAPEGARAARPAPLTMPGDFDGVVWYYASPTVPTDWAGRELVLELGAIDDFDVTYVNGVEVGRTGVDTPQWYRHPREYTVPAELVAPGEMTVAVRVFDRWADGGLLGPAEVMRLTPADDPEFADAEALPLHEWWTPRRTTRLDPAAVTGPRNNTRPYGPGHKQQASGLYNAMIHPVAPFGLRGVVWYQGESNANRAEQYRALMPALIHDWRQAWARGPFAPPSHDHRDPGGGEPLWFFMVQLAGFTAYEPEPADSHWAELRDAQLNTTRHVARTGVAVAADIGDADDIHPRNKHDVGERLARLALRDTYGHTDTVKSGPVFRDAVFVDGEAVVSFDLFGSTLESRDTDEGSADTLTGFTLAGEDRVFHRADARIDGDTVRVRSDAVPRPVAVRYGWQNNPADANLFNAAGLPASPFRSDAWPGATAGRMVVPVPSD